MDEVGWWEEAGAVQTTMFRRIPTLFVNDAEIYSQDSVLWHGVAGMSCLTLPC